MLLPAVYRSGPRGWLGPLDRRSVFDSSYMYVSSLTEIVCVVYLCASVRWHMFCIRVFECESAQRHRFGY